MKIVLPGLCSFYGLLIQSRHFVGVALNSLFPYLSNAGHSVGPEDKAEDLRNDVIEFTTLLRIVKFLAIGARIILLFPAACADFAPLGVGLVVTAGTAIFQKRSTRPAIQSAIRHQIYITVRHV
jgi:hypothetical protein